MGGSSGGGTTTQKSDPWAGQQPYLTYGFDQAQDQFESETPSYFEGSTVAPLSNTTQNALNATEYRAMAGSQLENSARNQQTRTINGEFLNSNPYLDANFAAGSDAITRQYNNAVGNQTAGFAGSGRLGSGMQAFYQNQQNDTLGKNLSNLYGQTYFQNYNNERANQQNAINSAPQFQQMDYNNLNSLSGVGNTRDQYAQNLTNADIDRFNYTQNLPANKLSQYMNLIQGNYGGESSTTTPKSGGSGFGQALGLGLQAASLFARSDRRLKTDIVAIGKADNGLTIYCYRYKNSPTYHLGFMADEVEKLIPEAVMENEDGFKMVNYDIATRGEA